MGSDRDAGAYRIFSADDHLDIYSLPPDLWSARLPARFRGDGPQVVERDGGRFWVAAGRVMGPSGALGLATGAVNRVHPEDDGFRPADPALRLEDMDLDGIHGSLVYGPGALLGFPIADPELKILTLRAWNDWAAEVFNACAPQRLCALAMLPTTSPRDAVAELQRAAELGHRGAVFRVFEVELKSREWEPLWSAAAEVGLPLSFHIGGGSSLNPASGQPWEFPAFSAVAPMLMGEYLSIMVFSGALERNPGLRLVLAESGVGWLPYLVARMDAVFEKHCARNPVFGVKQKPSDVFRRQVFATFEEEPFGPQLIPLLGPENYLWACDYPHADSTFPESRKAIEHALSRLGPEAVRRVVGENCRELYRFA